MKEQKKATLMYMTPMDDSQITDYFPSMEDSEDVDYGDISNDQDNGLD